MLSATQSGKLKASVKTDRDRSVSARLTSCASTPARLTWRSDNLDRSRPRRITAEEAQQIDHVARSIPMGRARRTEPLLDQFEQQCFCLARTQLRSEISQDCFADKMLLAMPNVLPGLRLHEGVQGQLQRFATPDFVAHAFDQTVRHVFEYDRLQREPRTTR